MTAPHDPAFPTLAEVAGKEVVGGDGMTLREYYAGMALQGLLANGVHALSPAEPAYCIQPRRFGEVAVSMADALLAALATPTRAAADPTLRDACQEALQFLEQTVPDGDAEVPLHRRLAGLGGEYTAARLRAAIALDAKGPDCA